MPLRLTLTSYVALIILISECPLITSKERYSELVSDSDIRREVNNLFTITQEDRDYLEHIDDHSSSGRQDRIVAGEEASLGKAWYRL